FRARPVEAGAIEEDLVGDGFAAHLSGPSLALRRFAAFIWGRRGGASIPNGPRIGESAACRQ
ncbi:MAG: hypothetical protein OXK73_00930, partial [Rhodospirillaceae bacterium]|nr:hypothetical protein [Rhodospirillaceae bacterium]